MGARRFMPSTPVERPIAALKTDALATAMAYGNAITGRVTAAYAEVEVMSWDAQEREARLVLAGEALPAHAILPGLAADKGASERAYAESIVANADRYRGIARAAVALRRRASDMLLDPAITTREQLDAAVAALKIETDALAAELVKAGP